MTGLVRADTELMLRTAHEMQRTSLSLFEHFAAAQRAMQDLQATPWSGNHRIAAEECWARLKVLFQPTIADLDDLAIRMIRTAEALDAAALTFGESTASGRSASFLANLSTWLDQFSALEILKLGLVPGISLPALATSINLPTIQNLLQAATATYGPSVATYDTSLSRDDLPPVYFSVNGIGSIAPDGRADPSGHFLQENFAAAGYNPNLLIPTPAVYNDTWSLNYTSSDWWGLGPVLNSFRTTINLAWGVTEVYNEHKEGENGPYTKQTMAAIIHHLNTNPALQGRKVVLVGHSGGGAVVTNLVPMLERQNIDVEAVVTMGSPVGNFDRAANNARIHEIRDQHDLIGLPIVRTDESNLWMMGIPALMPFMTTEMLQRNYQSNAARTTTNATAKGEGPVAAHISYHTNPAVAGILGQYYTNQHRQPTNSPTPAGPR